jgi:sucrose-6-phosphate hydrolase SacC (GH32 family)
LFSQYNYYTPDPAWGNMSWAHYVSADLVHWAFLPVALWPNNTYNSDGVWTGSVTIVQGAPVAAYTCVGPSGQLQCLAHPANVSDPLLVEWQQDAANPVIPAPPPGGNTGSFRDDTTGWYDEEEQAWFMAVGASVNPGNTAAVALYQSPDFTTWSFSNFLWQKPGGGMFECPDVFAVDGSPGLMAVKTSNGGDWITLGVYDAATRTFNATTPTVSVDPGQVYASKSYYDAPTNRRIIWGWVAEEDAAGPSRGWQGMQTLPRVMSYNAGTGLLDIAPLPELADLRNATLATVSGVPLAASEFSVLPSAVGAQLEIDAYFQLPSGSAANASSGGAGWEVGVAVRVNAATGVQTRFGIVVQPPVGPLNNTDQPGGDILDFALPANASEAANVAACAAGCASNAACASWTYVRPGYPAPSPPYNYAPRCSIKGSVPAPVPGALCCVSGVRGGAVLSVNRTNNGGDGPTTPQSGPLTLLPSDGDIVRLHVFADASVMEGFAQGGRARVTTRVYPSDPAAVGVALYADCVNATVLNATVWSMGTIWTAPEWHLAAREAQAAKLARGHDLART